MLLEHVVTIVPDVNSILWEFKFELMYLIKTNISFKRLKVCIKIFLFVKTIAF